MKIKNLILLLGLTVSLNVSSQTFTVTDIAPFSTTNQNMWGSGGALGLNMRIPLFDFSPPTMTTTVGGITNLASFEFGAELRATLNLAIGSDFVISGFEGGTVAVDFPTQINNIVPDSFTFEKGEWITIESNHNLQPGANLTTSFPVGGRFGLDMKFGFSTNVNTKLCVFSCSTIGLLPPGNPSGMLGVWPPATFSLFSIGRNATTSALDVQLAGATVAAVALPIPLNRPNIGIINSFLDLPQTATSSSFSGNCTSAFGTYKYFEMNFNLVKYLKPIPVVGSVLSNLNNSYNLPGGTTVSYNLFQALLTVSNNNVQQFTFCPNVNNTLSFPTEVLYRVIDTTTGTVVNSGFTDVITYHIGDDLEIKYPCNYEFIELTPVYSLDSTENNFRNRTYDSLDFSFNMSALAFSITIPRTTVLPPFPAFTVCIPIAWPCPTWNKPWRWCSGTSCTTTPAFAGLYFGPYNIGFGPLWSASIPIGSIQYDWFDQSWGLRGFNTVVGTSYRLKPNPYSVSLTGVDILCKNDSTGSLTATVLNGTPPYSYEWDNIQVNNSALTTNNMNGLSAGVHFVKVTDANGCSVFESYTLEEPAQELSVVNLIGEDVTCYNGNDGKATILMTGGTSPYAYNWSSGSSFDSITNVMMGNYTLTVTDNNNCTLDTAITLTQPDSITVSTAGINNVLCFGEATGSATINVIGGSPTYTYLWNNGTTTQNLSNVPAGNYTVTVTDLNSCTNTNSLTITEPATPVAIASLIGTNVACFGGNDGTITANVTGGVAPYSYEWFNSTGFQLSSSSNIANNLLADTYQLVTTDTNGCSTSQTTTITEPLAPISATFITTDVNCFGGADGNINMTVAGGTPPYTYSWSNGATTANITNIAAGNHIITITDNNSCIYVDTVVINEPSDSLSITNFTTTNILCVGDASGSINTTTFGGTLPYTYSWSSGQNTASINNVLAGNYTLNVTDGNSCVTVGNYTLTEPLQPINITNTSVNVSCFGGTDGSIDVTVTGGTTPYSYQWSNQDSIILSNTQQDLTGLILGTYTILVTDSNNCQLSSNITITAPLEPLSSIITATAINCFAGNNGTINLTPNGGTTPYTFLWNNGATTEDINNLTTGWYNVTVTDNNLCTAVDSIFVSEPDASLSASTTALNVSCLGGNNGGIQLMVNGGTTPYTFLWNNGQTTQNVDSLVAGVYSVTITDANDCIANSGGIVNQPTTTVSITNTVDSVSCYGFADGQINVTVVGGTMPYQLQWADSSFLLNQYTNTLSNLKEGDYTIIVTDGNDCQVRQNMTVFQPDTMTISYVTTMVDCYGGNNGTITTTVLGGTTPYVYLWNDTTTTPNRDTLIAGTYSVTVADYNNCSLKESMQITQPSDILITGDITEISCKDATDGAIYVLASGGTGSFMYQWATGELGQSLNGLAAGNYEVYVTDANGCMDTLMLVLNPSELTCIQIANTITPNGDGINDTWIIDKMELYPNASVQIFNQWGNLLYESLGTYVPWNGLHQGNTLPAATYYFIINLHDGSSAITGPITIVR